MLLVILTVLSNVKDFSRSLAVVFPAEVVVFQKWCIVYVPTVISEMWCLRKTFTYLLTYLQLSSRY